MKSIILSLLVGTMLLTSEAGTAKDLYCPGTILRVMVGWEGAVEIYPTIRGDWIQICNLNNTWQGISPKTCSAQFTQSMIAVQNQNSMMISYNNVDEKYECQSLPTRANSLLPSYLSYEK